MFVIYSPSTDIQHVKILFKELHFIYIYIYTHIYNAFSQGVRIPLKHFANFIAENIYFHNYFEIDAKQIPQDRKLCKHSNFSAVCGYSVLLQPSDCFLTSFPFP